MYKIPDTPPGRYDNSVIIALFFAYEQIAGR